MMPRKKRILILVISIVLVVLMIVGILGFLYLKTDAFKSNEVLFAKYLMQNFENIQFLKEDNSQIENALNNNKYTSQIEGKIQYTENIGTSDQNQNNIINNVGIKINSNVDKLNNYNYKDISINNNEEKLLGLEYLNQNDLYGIRLNDIKQFVSIEYNEENQTAEGSEILNIAEIDFDSMFEFTEEEKQILKNTYINIVRSNISSDKYYKQTNSLITINNQDMQTNAYYVKLTVEELNNLYIKILEQVINDEIILSKVDLLENELSEKFSNYEQEETLRQSFKNFINEEIEEIKNNNIGNEEIKITVYENNMKTVRTSIEQTTEKITIDIGDSIIQIDNTILADTMNQQIIKIEKTKNEAQSNIIMKYEEVQNNEKAINIELNYKQTFNDMNFNKVIQFKLANEKYEGVLYIVDNTTIVQEFEKQITLDVDNVRFDNLEKAQKEAIGKILIENVQGQLTKLSSVVTVNDYDEMLRNLNVVQKNTVEFPEEGEVTDIERKRFNSQFEFFVSENLTTDNINELMKVVENNFEDMKILTKEGNIEELDVERLTSQENTQYKENISEILIYIKQNTNNEEKIKNTSSYIKDNEKNKYNVSIEYDDDGLARVIRLKVQEN